MADEQLRDRIENYLLGKLSPEEAARLETEMAQDDELADQVALQRIALLGMQRLADVGMRTRFDRWDDELDNPEGSLPPGPSRSPGNPWRWTTLGLLLLLTAGAIWHFTQISKESAAQLRERREIALRDSTITALQAEYWKQATELNALEGKPGAGRDSATLQEIKKLREELMQKDRQIRALEQSREAGKPQMAMRLAPPAKNITTRSGGDDTDPVTAAAKSAFEKSDFNEAVRLLQSIPAGDPRRAQVAQLLPYAFFYAGRYGEAIPAFLNLWEQDPDDEAMNAQGYLLLCYVAEGRRQEARQLRLVILANPKHKFFKTAQSVGDVLR